jgi:hypothetical protein
VSPVRQTAPRSIVLAVVGAALGLAGLVALVVFVLDRGTQSGQVEVQLGSAQFDAGSAEQRAGAVRADGPILFTDVAGGTRDIYLQHLGPTDTEGWLAFDARTSDATRECTLGWQPAEAHFVDPCTGTVVPADGTGLVHYPVEVTEGGALVIDIRAGTTQP